MQGWEKMYDHRVQIWRGRQHGWRLKLSFNRGGRKQNRGQTQTTCPPDLKEEPKWTLAQTPSSRVSNADEDRDLHKRMLGLEESLKLIMVALKIGAVETTQTMKDNIERVKSLNIAKEDTEGVDHISTAKENTGGVESTETAQDET